MAGQPLLPPVSEIYASGDISPEGPLAQAFATLFEPSSALLEFLVPSVDAIVANPGSRIPRRTYNALIDLAISELEGWPHGQQASFLGGHPRIGEIKGLSALSASEQAAHATPPEEYERRYPGLRYITFVNGRSRKMIMEEMEEKLGMASLGKGGGRQGAGSRLVALRVDGDQAADDSE
ncbi:OHCU decarboxylase-domain-containing protein [Russula brevipes]|nr:OHCU decarboxylase-domain-containing protein [Russula brevipes]